MLNFDVISVNKIFEEWNIRNVDDLGKIDDNIVNDSCSMYNDVNSPSELESQLMANSNGLDKNNII